MIEQEITSAQPISMSERLEIIRLSKDRIKRSKLAMDDVALEVGETDELGVSDDDEL